jgi:hypothetical protein
MIFEVDSAILRTENLHHLLVEVTVSVWGSDMGRHQWYIADPETFKTSPWFAKYLSHPQQRDFYKFVTRSALDNPKSKLIFLKISTNTYGPCGLFNLLYAKKLLSSPLLVVVESAGSDGTFVKALIRCFGNKSIKTAVERDWIMFDNAGGSGGLGSAIGRIEERLSKEVAKRRTFVLFDSDHEHAKDNWRGKSESRARLELEENGYAIYGLYKRMIENYLPDEALKEIVTKRGDTVANDTLKIVLGFSPEQRDFYHLKKGFNYNSKVEGYPKKLFQNVFANKNSPDYRTLHKGFESLRLVEGFDVEQLVTGQSLRARCTHHPSTQKDELENIVKTLTEML